MNAVTHPNPPSRTTPAVYSYTRFSTPEQRAGDSTRRQADRAQRWADSRGYLLNDTLRDEGLSGYSGANRTRGALGAFLHRIESDDVAPGSILLVENIDRLSREDVLQAIDTVSQIIRKGVRIVTLEPEAEYDEETLNNGMGFQLLGQMQRAYAESKRKSELMKASRNEARRLARATGRVLTAQCPAWLTARPDRSGFDLIEPAATTIRLIYQWAAEGVSYRQMERRLNAEAPWTPPPRRKVDLAKGVGGNGWRASYIKKLLHNRAVIGEYQPHVLPDGKGGRRVPDGEPIEGYYPSIVPPELYHAVQAKLAANRGTGGRTGMARNVLTHLAKCAYCGGPMRYENKGKPPKGAEYLACDNGVRGVKCSLHRVRYDETVETLLDNCRGLRPADVLPNAGAVEQQSSTLHTRLAGLTRELDDIELKLSNLTERVADAPTKAIAERVYAQMAAFEEKAMGLAASKAQATQQLNSLQGSGQAFKDWQHTLETLKLAMQEDAPDLRLKLRAHLRSFIDRVEVFAVGFATAYDPDAPQPRRRPRKARRTDDTRARLSAREQARTAVEVADCIVDYAYDVMPPGMGKEFGEFTSQLLARRMSREGRFLRVHYKAGGVVDFVPPGSLASGMAKIDDNTWRHVEPDIADLWSK